MLFRTAALSLFLLIACIKIADSQDWPAERDTSSFLGKMIYQQYCETFPDLYMMPEWYNLQLIYIQVNRDSTGFPHLTYHKLGVDRNKYFYPASLVKLPTLLFTLEKLQELKKYGIDKYSRLRIGRNHSCQTEFKEDTTGLEDYPCIANFIRRILLVSDNQSYSRLFEFLGQVEYKKRFQAKGYTDPLVIKRFSRCSYDENRYTNPFWFYNDKGKVVYYQPPRTNPDKPWLNSENAFVGKGYYEGKKYHDKPKDFRFTNYLPLEDAVDMFVKLFLPGTTDSAHRWNISYNDRLFLMQYFSMYPRESFFEEYHDYEKFEDSYKKYFMIGDTKDTIKDSNLRIFNIVGLSYGFTTDIAYIVNLEEGVEFFLAGTMYSNENDILNDDTYDYHKVAFPFYGKFGRIIYEYERHRQKQYLPDFREIKQALAMPPM